MTTPAARPWAGEALHVRDEFIGQEAWIYVTDPRLREMIFHSVRQDGQEVDAWIEGSSGLYLCRREDPPPDVVRRIQEEEADEDEREDWQRAPSKAVSRETGWVRHIVLIPWEQLGLMVMSRLDHWDKDLGI